MGETRLMYRQIISKFLMLLFFILFVSLNIFGVVEKLSIEEKVKRADTIVLGTVEHMQSQWEAVNGGKRIFTYVYIGVEQYIKGVGGGQAEIKVPGGKVGEITEWVSDTPHFTTGEKVIVFLKPEYFQIVGWQQGKYTVKNKKVVGLGVEASKFINMVRKINEESYFGLDDALPTQIDWSGEDFKSKETPVIGHPCQEIISEKVLKSASFKIKDEEKKEISGVPPSVSSVDMRTRASWTTIMQEDFEGVFPSGSWTVQGDPTWDDDDYKPHTGSWSAWCANGGSLGLDPEFNNYPNNMNAWMIYGPFDLSDAVDAELLFYYWNESETGADKFKYYASANGTSFYGYGVSGSTGGWNYVNFDLTNVYSIGNLCGDSSVWIAFKFDSDSTNSYKGAFVDDIILQKTTGTEPNLTPYQPSGWADKIVVSNHTGDNDDDSPLYSTDTLYIDWAVINNGAVATDDTFYTRLYVDGLLEATFSTPPPLDPTWYAYISDYSLGSLAAGSHTIKIVADYDDRITESDENDNEYQRIITIETPANVPQISSISPDIASAGTDTTVTINGSNFGATQGSSKVEFFYRNGQPKIEAPIISWSDAQIQCIVPVDTVNGYAASSSSGPVTVTTENGTSNGYIFKVTFGYGEVEWPDAHPWILYEINENTSDCTGEGSAVIAGANEWNNRCAGFTFVYDGPTSATDYSYNGHNEIMWGSTGGSLASAVYWYSGSNILECDIVYDDSYTWCTDGSAGEYDIQNIATHELGHWLNLRDIYGDIGDGEYDTAKTMYGFGAIGETKKRTLHADDISGIRWIYGTGGDSWDPADDTGSGGTTLSPTDGTWQSHGRHTLASCDQDDWFRIYMDANYSYYFKSLCDFPADSTGHGDVIAYLYSDSSGTNQVQEDDDSGGNYQFEFSYRPSTSGYYYLEINTYTSGYFWSGYIDYKRELEGTPPSIITHPQSQTINYNTAASLSVAAAGTAPLSYQWYQGEAGDTSTPVGEDSDSYTTPNLTATTSYWVRVSNAYGTDDSNTATITVNLPSVPEINIKYDTTNIPDGGSCDFGSQSVGTDTDVTFTIENTGAADLILSGSPIITFTGADADQFSVQQQPTSPISDSGSTTFIIRFSPSSEGFKEASISIVNNDTDENPYDITLEGTGVVLTGSLMVTIEPHGAIDAGAQWKRLCTTTWYDSGNTESDIPAGNVIVEFKEVGGWLKPANEIVSIPVGDTAVFSGIYMQLLPAGTFVDSGLSLGDSDSENVALGDVDGDGDLDAFVVNSGSNKVWLNDGSGVFTDSGQNLGSSSSHSIALGDVDGDGDLDAFVGNSGSNKVWLNDGSGTFTDSGQNLGSSGSYGVALGDLDCDGDLDTFVANYGAHKVWLNDGSGTFTDSGQSLGDCSCYGMALGDLDSDGDLDAFVCDRWDADKVWLNDGNGNFTDSGQNLSSSESMDVAFGDVDRDGDLDAFVASFSSQGSKVWLNNGSGMFTDSGQNLGSTANSGVAIGDLDGDGDLDAFIANWWGANSVLLNDGNGIFTDSGQSLGDSYSDNVALGDMDGDGDLDAFVANGNDTHANKVWLNTCVAPEITEHPQSQTINYDTTVTLSVTATSAQALSYQWYRGDSGDTSTPVGEDSDSYTTPNLTEITSYWVRVSNVCGSVDSDTATICVLPAIPIIVSPSDDSTDAPIDTDLDWEDSGGATSYDVYFGDSSPPPYVETTTESYYDPGTLDYGTIYYWKIVAKNDCGNTVGSEWNFTTISLPSVPEINIKYDTTNIADGGSYDFGSHSVGTDMDVTFTIENTGTADLVLSGSPIINITGADADQFSVQQQPTSPISDGGSTTFIIRFSPNSEGFKEASISIVNNDADENPYDITLEGTGVVLTGSLTVTIEPQGAIDAGAQWKRLCTTTWYDSGNTESDIPAGNVIVEFKEVGGWLKPANEIVSIPVGDTAVFSGTYTQLFGSGVFVDSGQSLGDSDSESAASGDVDGDGDLDVFVVNSGSNKVWLNDGSGVFTDSGQSLGSSGSYGVGLGDLDCDGDLDAFVGNYYSSNEVWLNDGSGTFTDSGQNFGTSRASDVSLGDLDCDGDLDAFVAKYGGHEVWLNDGSGTFTDSGQSLGDSSPYGMALGDVDGDGDLDAFISSRNHDDKVWLNDGSGTFTDSGQSLSSSESMDVALGDVDKDGDLDAFVASFSNQGSKVWLNNGSGTFTDSGQSLGSSANSGVALGDVDGDGDLDAFIANWWGANSVWLNDGNGIFTDSGQSLGDSYSDNVALGDMDGDGDLDAFVANGNDTHANKVWLNTCVAPEITEQPQSQTINYNTTATLSVTATSIQALSYQWYQGDSGDTSTPVGEDSDSYTTPNLTATTSYWVRVSNVCGSVDSDTATITVNLPSVPEINIKYDTTNIADGGSYDFGSHSVGTDTDVTFTIENTGTADLILSGSPIITFTGADADQFSVQQQPTSPISDGGSTTFIIRFSPSSEGFKEASISIVNNDADENPYDITLEGTGVVLTGSLTVTIEPQGAIDAGAQWKRLCTTTWYDSGYTESDIPAGNVIVEFKEVGGWLKPANEIVSIPVGDTAVFSGIYMQLLPAGTFIDSGQSLGDSDSDDVALGDLDGDGDLDAFVDNFGAHKVWLNDGSGTFTDSGQSLGDIGSIALGDLDCDGDLDAFVASYKGHKVWLNDGSGTFIDSGQSLGDLYGRVALGDLDCDGDLDAFLAGSEYHKVWLNDGSGMFTDSGQSLGDSSCYGMALGDLDNDGDLDAFSCNRGNADKVWLNDGSGTFTDSGQNLGSSDSMDVALGDVDGDGDLDAYVAGFHSQDDKVWLNDGNGTFTDSGQSLGSTANSGVALGDVDGDGDLDAFIANWWGANSVLLNNGSGMFTDSGQSLGDSDSDDVALGDLDGDGDLDAFVANGNDTHANKVWLNTCVAPEITEHPQSQTINYDTTVTLSVTATSAQALSYQWYQGDSGDTSTPVGEDSDSYTTPNLTATTSYWVRLSNVCGSVDSDTATITVNPPSAPEINIKYDTTNIPDGGSYDFGSHSVGTDTDVTFTIENTGTADLILSGSPIITITGADAGQFSVQQQPASSIPSGSSTTFIIRFSPSSEGFKEASISIVNNDGDENPYDITLEGTGVVLTGSLMVTIEPQGAIDAGAQWKRLCTTTWYDSEYTESDIPAGNVIVEFKEVGGWLKPDDQIVSIIAEDTAVVTGIYIRLTGSGVFVDSDQSLDSEASRGVKLGDVDGDGDLDAFVVNASYQANKVWLNDGSGTLTDSGQSLGSGYSFSVVLGDVDNDGDLDAFVVNDGSNKVWLNDGNGTFSDSGQSLGNGYSWGVRLGDVDCDGDLDAFVANHDEPNKVWLNDSNGTFVDSGQSLGDSKSMEVALGDLDGDGDLDVFVANAGNQANRVWLNDGSGNFTDSGKSLANAWSLDVGLRDLDGDGDLDAFVANSSSQANKVWLNDGSGTFTDSGQSLGDSYSLGLELGDVDGDGDLDVFIANSLNQANKVWLNDGSGNFTGSGQSLGSSTSHEVALGDVDGDGDLDALVGNSGINKLWLNTCVPPEITEQPQSQTINYNTTATLSVTATSMNTLSYQWYQGSSGDTSTPLGEDSDYYTAPNLTQTTSYWVRVSNVCGSVDSDTATICVLPATPINLSPSDGSTDASVDTDLDWEDSSGATEYDVYFGTSSSPPYVATVTESYYDPGALSACSTYYWKVVAKNECGETHGEEWSFATVIIPPESFSNLSPSNGAADVSLDTDLDWEDSVGAVSYDVYFGTVSPPPYEATVAESFYDPGVLNPNITYYWYVAAKNSCGDIPGDEWSFTTKQKSWTFMVYLDGDNNLEEGGINDFLEMASVGSNADVNVVVQFDRIDGYDTSYGDWTTTKRFYITSGMTPTADNALEDLGELNQGDPQTLIDFIDWAKTNYPAEKYALVLWNHGGGWREAEEKVMKARLEGKKRPFYRAVCWDETDEGDTLYMDEVQGALDVTGSNHLIGFDASVMGMVEVAYEIRDYGEVMVGSEETEPGDGWPYDLILQDLVNNPSWSSSELGQAIVDRYYESYGDDATQSAIDLTALDTLASTISSFAQSLMDNWNTDEAAVKSAASEVMTQIENAVIHEQHGADWPGAYGLAVYFPLTSGEFDSDYESVIDFTNDTQWEEFLQEFHNSMAGSWIQQRRAITQQFICPEHVDLYHFCELLNTETDDYYTRSEISHDYLGGGTAWDFHYDEASRTYNLPFDFPFFEETIPEGTIIYVCSNGYVDFNDFNIDYSNSGLELANNKRIAPYWVDLRTDGSAQSGEDVYITENTDSLVIRWVAQTYSGAVPVNVELILYADGRIQFNYDGGNDLSTTLYSPTIGISKGDGINCYFAAHNGQKVLTDVDSAVFTPIRPEPPSLPVNPSPENEATEVSSETDLDWDDCIGATSYDIYLGTSSPPPFVTTVSTSYYDPGTLNGETTYYWKVVAKNDYGETPGEEWQFTVYTTCTTPGPFSNLTPSNGASGISLNVDLDWEDSSGATYYDVFFGTTSPPPILTGTADSYMDVGSLSANTTYYWRIDAENDCGITFGEEWSFTTRDVHQCSLTITAGGGGTTNPEPGTHTYDSGTEVTITAQPESEYEFSHWKGDVPEGHEGDNPLTLTMDSDKSITANFVRQYTLTIMAGEGGTTNPSPDSYTYDSGARVSITAMPGDGYRFSGWTGDVPSGDENDNPLTVTVDSNRSVTAHFIRQYTLTIAAGTGGTTNPSPGSYVHDTGASVSVTATANSGYSFSVWSGDVPSGHENDNPLTITMSSDKSITASFGPDDSGGGGGGGDDEGDGGGGGCFIATAAYGSPLHPHIDILRQFRDKYLMTNTIGRKFVAMYYKYSPSVAERIGKYKILKVFVRIHLLPLVALGYSVVYLGPIMTAFVFAFIFMLPIFLFPYSREKYRGTKT